jgi:HEAT repeats
VGNKGRILVVSFVIMVLALFTWQVMSPHEPVYEGKKLSVWLEAYAHAPGFGIGLRSPEQMEADKAMRQIGTNAIPTLLKMLRFKNHPLNDKIAYWLKALHLSREGYVHESVKHSEAAEAFRVLGPQVKEAVPELIKIYDENLSVESQSLLPEIFGSIGTASKEAIPTLIRMTQNTNVWVRNNAVFALGLVAEEPETVVPVLIKAIDDPDPWVRHNAVGSLDFFGRDAKAAIPKLLELRKSDDSSMRERAEIVLQKMDPKAVQRAEVQNAIQVLQATDVKH